MPLTRAEYLRWAKDRALAYLEPAKPTFFGRLSQKIRHAVVPLAQADQVIDAWNSFTSDLKKHPDLMLHPAILVGMTGLLSGTLRTVGAMRDFLRDID